LRRSKFLERNNSAGVGILLVLVSMAVRYGMSNSSHEAHALKYLQEKKFDQAIAEASEELDAHPNNVAALADRGTAYLRKQMNDKALSDFGRAIGLNPQNYLALAGKCEVDAQARAYNDSIAECSRALTISSAGVLPYLYRAAGYEAEGRYELAEKDLQSAIQLMPNTAPLYALQGGAYVQDGQLEKAREYFQKASGMDPNAMGLFIGRGTLEVLLNDSADALRDLDQAVEQIPSDATSIIWLHNAKYHDGENDSVELEKWRRNLTDAKWPSTAVDLYAGKTTVDAVRAQANADGVEAAAVQACQAEYYIGEYYLQHGDRANAHTSLLSAANSCPQNNSAEKQAASIEIKAAGF
jgi:tetratricopeptide (TPR) repeat protein